MLAADPEQTVRSVVAKVARSYRRQLAELLRDHYYSADRENLELRVAQEIKQALDRALRSNWNVCVGASFGFALHEQACCFAFPLDPQEPAIAVLVFDSHNRVERFIM